MKKYFSFQCTSIHKEIDEEKSTVNLESENTTGRKASISIQFLYDKGHTQFEVGSHKQFEVGKSYHVIISDELFIASSTNNVWNIQPEL